MGKHLPCKSPLQPAVLPKDMGGIVAAQSQPSPAELPLGLTEGQPVLGTGVNIAKPLGSAAPLLIPAAPHLHLRLLSKPCLPPTVQTPAASTGPELSPESCRNTNANNHKQKWPWKSLQNAKNCSCSRKLNPGSSQEGNVVFIFDRGDSAHSVSPRTVLSCSHTVSRQPGQDGWR